MAIREPSPDTAIPEVVAQVREAAAAAEEAFQDTAVRKIPKAATRHAPLRELAVLDLAVRRVRRQGGDEHAVRHRRPRTRAAPGAPAELPRRPSRPPGTATATGTTATTIPRPRRR